MNLASPMRATAHHVSPMRLHSPVAAPSTPHTAYSNSNNSSNNQAPVLLTCSPSSATVDYDINVTPLYEHIGNSDWDAATNRCRTFSQEAATWVVRYQRDSMGNKTSSLNTNTTNNNTNNNTNSANNEVLWRFLPIHSACALNPPTSFLRTLLQAYPDGARTLDDQGMLPLHYACGAKCPREVLYLLLMSFPQAALKADPNGMLPLHYLAQWGPSREGSPGESGVVDMVCVATGHKVGPARDGDGNTPEMLALRAEYPGHEEVARKICEFAARHGGNGGSGSGSAMNMVPRTPTRASSNGHSRGDGGGSSSSLSGFGFHTPTRNYDSIGNHLGNTSSSFNKRSLSIQTSTTPRGGGGGQGSSTSNLFGRPHSTPNRTTPATTGDKYSSFDAAEEEMMDDCTLIEHEPEGNIEISLSNPMSPSVGSVANSNKNSAYPFNNGNGTSGSEPNENANVWNQMTPRSTRGAMNKLGVSPVNAAKYGRLGSARSVGNKERFNTWDNNNGGGTNDFDGGLNKNSLGSYQPSPRAHRPTRSFSWDQGDPTTVHHPVVATNNNAEKTVVAAAEKNEKRVFFTTTTDASSTSGSTWTTAIDQGGQRGSSPTARRFSSVVGGSTAGIGGPPSHVPATTTPRGSRLSLPPKSPRVVATTPKSRNGSRYGNGSSGGNSYNVIQQQREQQQREPSTSGKSEQELQDQRLLELREELSGASASIRTGSVGSFHSREQRSGSAGSRGGSSSDRYHAVGDDEGGSIRSGLGALPTIASNDGSSSSSRSFDRSGSTANGDASKSAGSLISKTSTANSTKHSNASYGTQLAEQLRAIADQEADEQRIKDQEAASKRAELEKLEKELEQKRDAAEAKKREEEQKDREAAEAAAKAAHLEELQRLQLEKEISRLEADKERSDAKEQMQKLQLRAEKERSEMVQKLQAEKVQSENALLEEISRLRADKDKAEAALGDITMMAPVWSASVSESSQSNMVEGRDDDEDDGISKLTHDMTFLDNDVEEESEHDVVEVVVSPRSSKSKKIEESDDVSGSKGSEASVASASINTEDDVMARLLKDKARIESAIQNVQKVQQTGDTKNATKNASKPPMIKTKNCQDDDSMTFASASTAMTPRRAAIVAESTKAIAELLEQVSKQKRELDEANAKSAEFEKQVKTFQDEKEGVDSEAVYNHLQEVKSLRESLDKATMEIEKLQSNDKGGALKRDLEALTEREKEWNEQREKHEGEIKELNEKCWTARNEESKLRAVLKDREEQWKEQRERYDTMSGTDSFSVLSDAKPSSVVTSTTEGSTIALHMKLDNAVKEAEDMRKFNAAIRKEHSETIGELESALEKERSGKTETLSQVVTLQYKIATLEQDLEFAKEETARASEFNVPTSCSKDNLEVELYKLKDKLREKLTDAEKSRQVLDDMKAEYKEKERHFEEKERDAEKESRKVIDKIKAECKEREQRMQQKLDAANERISQLEAELMKEEEQNYKDAAEEQQQKDSHFQQIRDLKKRIQGLQEEDVGHAQKLWEANKLRERALQDKEDECAATIRTLKKEHEKVLIEKEDAYLTELREVKKNSDQTFRAQESAYLEQLREGKKKEQAMIEKEDELLKQISDKSMKDSFSDMQIDNIIKQKDEEFEKTISKIIKDKDEEFEKEVEHLQSEVKRLRKERKEATQDNVMASELETQLLECKKDLDRQRRKHKSEMNKLKNSFELQKNKEGRLQSHIESMEKQISDMVNDYESRLQEAFYDNM